MIDYPLGTFTEKRRARMNKHHLVVDLSFVSFSGVFSCDMVEKAGCNCLSDLGVVFSVQLTT